MKKQSTLKLSIPTPCRQGWENMTPTERGRHCASCNKTVIDFTLYSDRELMEFFKKNKGPVCGHIPVYNLNRNITVTELRKRTLFERLLMGTALASWLGISSTANAQAQHTGVQARYQNIGFNTEQSIAKTEPGVYAPDTAFKVIGKIIDSAGKPAKNVTVSIYYYEDTMVSHNEYGYNIEEPKNELKSIIQAVETDSTGNYSIGIPAKLKGKEISMVFSAPEEESYSTILTIEAPFVTVNVRLFSSHIYLRGRVDATEYIIDGMVVTTEKFKEENADKLPTHFWDNHLSFPRSYEEGETDVVLPPPSIPTPKNSN
jgi:hypothetical protein